MTSRPGDAGVIHSNTTCRCERRIRRATAQGRLRPDHLPFARHPVSQDVIAASRDLTELHSVGELMRSHPAYAAPGAVSEAIADLLRTERYPVLDDDRATPDSGRAAPTTPVQIAKDRARKK